MYTVQIVGCTTRVYVHPFRRCTPIGVRSTVDDPGYRVAMSDQPVESGDVEEHSSGQQDLDLVEAVGLAGHLEVDLDEDGAVRLTPVRPEPPSWWRWYRRDRAWGR